ncbi:M14 family metallopeptidase [Luteimonas sp. MC1895]|uniref:M14 family metallopeptidase n=1 Tax=Luteimonas sp. MC1895 TaxID=2819513 RepID=UPI0018F0BBBD|nr:M14 family metallopeptidase [Luteimonas sp. MC1895]MBJ6978164.1 M14 family metallopeptidase [Luteimonas sp. MC1895]
MTRPSPALPASLALALLLGLAPATGAPAATTATRTSAVASLVTEAERSGFQRTGRYAEVLALCDAFAARYPQAVRCIEFGTTPEGRPMKALVASRSGALTPGAARSRGLPVLLVQGGIHAGEVDGKDAGFLALRELLAGEAAPGALDDVVLVFVPVFNADGHERFGRWNRPNQRGPEEMGWRTTAQNYNLNRDYVKADAPEMRAMLGLVQAWDPIAYVDLHATNGAQFEHDISVQIEPLHSGDAGLARAGLALREALLAGLTEQGSLPLPFYPSFEVHDDPSSGIVDGVAPPRFSHGYFALRNRFGILVETHSWKEYPVRVRITRNLVVGMLEQTARHGRDWLAAAAAADARAATLAGTTVPLEWVATDRVRTVDFRGYAWTRTPSEVSGTLATRYDETTPQLWKMPLRDEIVPGRRVPVPGAGYLVPPAHAAAAARWLDLHGIGYRRLAHALPAASLEVFRASEWRPAAASSEGRQRLELEGDWAPETRDVAAGALFVPVGQPRARLAMAILEPQAPDSMLAWGEFNNAFERKEYMEAYVAEDVARDMLRDPAVRAAFERRLAEDAAFAASASARLEWFHRRHASWDERLGLYPVFRTAVTPP